MFLLWSRNFVINFSSAFGTNIPRPYQDIVTEIVFLHLKLKVGNPFSKKIQKGFREMIILMPKSDNQYS